MLIWLDEESIGIRYHNSSKKGRRPFIIISITKKRIVLFPLSKSKNKINKRGWKVVKIKETNIDCFVKRELPTILYKDQIIFYLSTVNKNTNKPFLEINWNVFLLNKKEIKKELKWFITLFK